MKQVTRDVILLVFGWLFVAMVNVSCVTSGKSEKESAPMDIMMAKGYFVKNTIIVNEPIGMVFQSQQQLDSIMGVAATMGENGKPTSFDFSKEYGVACIFPETDSSRVLELIDYAVSEGKGRLSIKVITGAKQSYSMVPLILIKVSGMPPNSVMVEKTFVGK